MPQQTNNIPPGVRKWAIIGGGVALLVGAVVIGILYRVGRLDPGEATRLAAEQLTAQVKDLMDSGEFGAAAGAIESFLKDHPDGVDIPLLWALKIASHRKGGDVTKALLAVKGMDDNLQGRGRELCDAGAVLVSYECLQDAAKAYKLAMGDASVRHEACYHAAMCHYRLGRFAMAMKYIDAALVLRPNDPKTTAAVKRIEDARFVGDK